MLAQRIYESLQSRNVACYCFHFISWSLANCIGGWLGQAASGQVNKTKQKRDNRSIGKFEIFFRIITIFIDLLRFRIKRWVVKRKGYAVLIADRYFWDILVSLEYWGWKSNIIKKILFALVPDPEVPLYVDVDENVAYSRKPEHSAEYYKIKKMIYEKDVALRATRVNSNNGEAVISQVVALLENCGMLK
ncbi:MAG: hypothetical protein ABII88_11050 [Candidatus Omnitrophota bacterium]